MADVGIYVLLGRLCMVRIGVKERFARSCGVQFALFVCKRAEKLCRASGLVAAVSILSLLLPDPTPPHVALPLAGLHLTWATLMAE